MNTYTPSTGNTPQGQQLAQGQPNAANTQPPPGSPATAYPSDQQLNQSYSAANQTLVNQGTPDKLQQYITNSNMPAMQSNYDAEDKANARSGTGVGSDLKSADAYQQMKDAYVAQQQKSGKPATYDGLWDFMNTQKNALAAAGYDMDLIYKLQGQDRSMFGGNGDVTSGKPNIYKPNDPMKQYKVTSSKSPKGVVQWKVDKGGTGVWTVTDDSGFFGRKPTLSPDEIVTYGRSQGEADDVIKKSLVYAGYTVK